MKQRKVRPKKIRVLFNVARTITFNFTPRGK